MKYLPSNKVLGFLIVAVALVFSIIITFGKEKSSNAINFANNIVAGERVTIPQNSNWKNELVSLGTDFKEVTPTDDPATLTDKVSVSFMSNYLGMKQDGSLTADSAQKLIDQTDIFISTQNTAVYTEKDLNIINDNSILASQNYGEELGNILRSDRSGNKIVNEMEVFTEAVRSNNPQKLKDLKEVGTTYKTISIKILEMRIPKKFVKAHLDMLNGLKGLSFALQNMSNVFTDPVLGLQGMRKYQESVQIYYNARMATVNFLKINNINYKQGSGGYYLYYGI